MARRKNGSVPSYRLHKARNLAVVTVDGRDYYLGTWDTPSSKKKYADLVRAWQNRQERHADQDQVHVHGVGAVSRDDEPLVPDGRPTVDELILVYLQFVVKYYKPNHGENKEAGCVDDALKVVQACGYGTEPADAFRPKDLVKVRDAMVAKGWSRRYTNHQVARVKRMFAHAVQEDLIPGTVYHALTVVRGLRKGTPGVRETKKVRPVPVAHIKLVLAEAHTMLKAMLLFVYRTGARPGEVCAMKPCYLERKSKVWVYLVPPDANKTDHHDQERKIYIGPRAQKLLEPWLKDIDLDDYVFSPIRADAVRQAERRAKRKTPLWPSHLKHQAAKRKANPAGAKRDHYEPKALRQAVNRLCDAAGIPAWSPNRLRHNAATRFRKRYGLETARILLGHRKMNTTEIYAEADHLQARRAVRQCG